MPPENQTPPVHLHVNTRDHSSLYIPGAIVIAGVIIGVCILVAVTPRAASQTAPAGTTQPAAAVDIKKVKTAGEPYIGNVNAPVTLAFWSDYQCPFCKAFEVGGVSGIPTPAAMPDLLTKYVNTGKLKIVFKDFPFLGNDSVTAAEYARAIWNLYPSQFLAWRTAMFVAQDQEGDQGFGNAVTIDALIKAKFPQIDDAKVKADVATNKAAYDAAMQADMQEGESFGIQGTPGFITGTTLIDGDQPLSAFTATIDPQLK